jgi:hypothetical protein
MCGNWRDYRAGSRARPGRPRARAGGPGEPGSAAAIRGRLPGSAGPAPRGRRRGPASASPAVPTRPPATRTREQTPQVPSGTSRLPSHAPTLPRPVTPVSGEVLISYLTRLACANHLTLTEVLAVLPSWFSTKVSNRDDRAQHHMLIPAAPEATGALARLTGATPGSVARALPAFGTPGPHSPVRGTTACHRCAACRGIRQPVPVHLPAHRKVCTRHGIWLSDAGQPQLDLAACPEIIAAQHRASRLLRRCTPQELVLAYQAAARAIPPWPTSPAAIPLHWRHRLLTLQTANHRYGTPDRSRRLHPRGDLPRRHRPRRTHDQARSTGELPETSPPAPAITRAKAATQDSSPRSGHPSRRQLPDTGQHQGALPAGPE